MYYSKLTHIRAWFKNVCLTAVEFIAWMSNCFSSPPRKGRRCRSLHQPTPWPSLTIYHIAVNPGKVIKARRRKASYKILPNHVINKTGVPCNKENPSESHLKMKSCEMSRVKTSISFFKSFSNFAESAFVFVNDKTHEEWIIRQWGLREFGWRV